jgi:alanyl-tRNA synthetase
MNSNEVRDKFLKFFESKGHKIMPSSSLVPENDPSVLFTTAGMQQFKPYYGAPDNAVKDFGTKNITTSQKCVRTGDIDEVGDATHLTFFEMLGNFSFGGYGRKEAIEYAHEFITKELGLPISYVTFYKGEGVVPKDEESRAIWESLGVQDIREDGADVFWGPTGLNGPCGPTTEIYCKNADGQDVEVWNVVFNEYFCDGSRDQLDKGEAKLTKAESLGIDTGMGFERLLATVQNKKNVYETDLFENAMNLIKEKSINYSEVSARILADHARTARFIILDGAIPSNTDRGYVLRRIIRRAVLHTKKLGIEVSDFGLGNIFAEVYAAVYPELGGRVAEIDQVLNEEREKFNKTLEQGLKEFEKGIDPFILATTYGFPIEVTLELALEKGIKVDLEDFNKKTEEHQKLSQTSSAGMFKGGLANHNEQTIKLHTAHHLLLAALQQILGPEVKQRGSNITEERLRMDFAFDRKMTDEEKVKVEEIVNEYISRGLNVVRREMPLSEAEKLGAEMEFGAKYPETVSLYFVEDENANAISKEFCGGPHVTNTKELGVFKIQKEEASSAGVRRIKAVLS